MARHRTFNPARVGSSPTAPTNAGARRPRDQGTGLLNRQWQFESARALQFNVAHALMRAASPLLGTPAGPAPG